MNSYYVYVYYRPDTGLPLYVGKGKGKRYLQHMTDKPEYCFNKRLTGTIRNYIQSGQKPVVKIHTKNLTEEEALSLEVSLIKEYGRKGIDPEGILMNISEGGEKTGPAKGSKGTPHTEETKKKMSDIKKEKFDSGDIVIWNKGKEMTEEYCQKIKDSRNDRCRAAARENIKKATEARRGTKQSDYQKQKASEAKQKTYILTSPEGEEITITNLSKFCRENGMPHGTANFVNVAKGKLKHYKKWKARYPD